MTGSSGTESNFLNYIEMGLGAWAWGDSTLWNFGREYAETDIEQAFHTSLAAGINLVDTAEVYGSGRSERFLGKFLKTTITPVTVATKFMPFPWLLNRNALMRSLENSLERLELDRVDLYQIHWPFPPMPVEFWVEGMVKAVEAGKVRAVGVSNFSQSQMERADAVLKKHNLTLASNQVEYHLLNRAVEKNGLLSRCKEMGIRLIAYSPLAKGLLTGKYSPESPPPGVRSRQPLNKMKALPRLIAIMKEVGQGHERKTPAQVAINWLICKGALPIPGAKNALQAGQNAGALGWRLTSEEVQVLDDASDQFSK